MKTWDMEMSKWFQIPKSSKLRTHVSQCSGVAISFHSIPFFPPFFKNRRVEGNSNFKVLFPSTFLLILEITISFPFDCYFLPFYRIAISFHFFWSINSISKSANLRSLHLKNKSILITIWLYMQKGQIFVWAVPKMVSFALLIY